MFNTSTILLSLQRVTKSIIGDENLPIWREFQIEYTSGMGYIVIGHIVLPFGDGIQGRVHLAVQTTLIAKLGPKTIFPITQIGVTEVGGPPALDALQTVWIVVCHAHDVCALPSVRAATNAHK